MQRNGAFFFTEVVLVRCFQGFLHDLERPVGGDAKNGFPLTNRHLLQRAIEKDHGIETDDVDGSVYVAGLETGSLNWALLVVSAGMAVALGSAAAVEVVADPHPRWVWWAVKNLRLSPRGGNECQPRRVDLLR